MYLTNYINIPVKSAGWWTFAHTWSLSTEEQFYLLWPIMIVAAGRKRAPLILLIITLAMPAARLYMWAVGHSSPDVSKLLHLNADHLATGGLLALSLPRLRASLAYMTFVKSRWSLLLPIAILALNTPSSFIGFQRTLSFTLLNILIAVTIDAAVCNQRSLPGRFLNWKPVAFIGTLSYSLYLWQQPFTGLGSEWATFHPTGI